MFCAIATTIERCKTEGVVDVFQVVKALRVQKPGAVCNVVRITSSVYPMALLYATVHVLPRPLPYFRSNIRQFLRQL